MRRGHAQCALARTLSAAVRVRAIASEKTEVVVRVKLARVSVEAGFDGYRLLQCWRGKLASLRSTTAEEHILRTPQKIAASLLITALFAGRHCRLC